MLYRKFPMNYNSVKRAIGNQMIKTQSERRFRALIEKSVDAILLVDLSSAITYANPAVGALLGFQPTTVLGRSIYDLIHPQDRKFVQQLLGHSINNCEDTCELRFRTFDGTWRWLEGTLTNLLDDPSVEGIYLNLRDITARKEAERHLESQKDLLQNLVVIARATSEAAELENVLQNLLKIGKWLTQANSGSVFTFDKIGAVAYTRSFFSRLNPNRIRHLMEEGLTGWVIKQNQPALVHDTNTDERWLEVAATGYNPRSAVAIPIISGQNILAILVLTHAKPGHFNSDHLKTLQAASGQMAMAINNARLYDEAQSNLADLNALIESSQDGILLVSIEGYVRVINAAALKVVGASRDPAELIGCSIVNLYHLARHYVPDLVKAMIVQSRRVQAGDKMAAEGECKIPNHYIQWLHTPITTKDETIGWLVVLRDITERRKLEKQREELTDMIVHDLRNPASAVSGIVSMLKTLKSLDEIPEDFDQMMQLAERNVSKILDMVQEILDVSQLENGQLPVNKAAVDMAQLIDETLQLQRPIVSMKGMALENRVEKGLPLVRADERLIRRVLQNLVDNAVKFSRRNTSIIMSAEISADNPKMVQISIQDFGVGIAPDLQRHMFEKFVSDRSSERGTGIGLTFCKLAVMAHNGRIWAESEENYGSTFYFTLPIATA